MTRSCPAITAPPRSQILPSPGRQPIDLDEKCIEAAINIFDAASRRRIATARHAPQPRDPHVTGLGGRLLWLEIRIARARHRCVRLPLASRQGCDRRRAGLAAVIPPVRRQRCRRPFKHDRRRGRRCRRTAPSTSPYRPHNPRSMPDRQAARTPAAPPLARTAPGRVVRHRPHECPTRSPSPPCM